MKHVLLCLLIVLVPVSLRAGTAEGDFLHSGVTNTTPDPAAYGQVVRPINGSPSTAITVASAVTTITISGTAPVADVCAPFTAPFPYLFVTTTNTTGTGASGTGKVGY